MELIDYISDVRGCYVLGPQAQIGKYDEGKEFRADAELSSALAPLVAAFDQSYQRHRDTADRRLAIVHPNHRGRPWQGATLEFEGEAIQRGAASAAEAPDEQAKSLYRGMEWLLGRNAAGVPQHCPLLVYRGTTRAYYASASARDQRPGDLSEPVVEVIDLLAGADRGWKTNPAVVRYLENLRRDLVHPERRKATDAVPAAERPRAPPKAPSLTPKEAETERIFQRYAATGFKDWDYRFWIDSHCTPVSRSRFGQALRATGSKYVQDPEALRFFARFAVMDPRALVVVAARNPVLLVPPGFTLLDNASDPNWSLYLLRGELDAQFADGSRSQIRAGMPTAQPSINLSSPGLHTVVSRTTAAFLWLHEPMLDAVARRYPAARWNTPPARHAGTA